MLEFEHIVQVNDPGNSDFVVLTRDQLWQGLVLRARNPEKFNRSLQCQSETPEGNEFIRTIEAGGASFCERVILYPQEKICTRTLADQDQINAQSTTCIEEPEEGYLFVRFTYKRDLDSRDDRVDVGEHLKSAYVQIDRVAIAMIRLLTESEMFDQSIN
ncbi:MAG: DUF1857 family protein [Proteobacteria bacterium]|nr:DUF1857 family protein [Pseudomonadota bacterium]